jgi:A/G-specific adenine glycosylase
MNSRTTHLNTSEREFVQYVRHFYRTQGRHTLPWRQTHDPYHIAVSEIMLQQTQVDRVVPYYERFVAEFPTVQALASAPLRDVLVLWQGLGYNRRAKLLRECAQTVLQKNGGRFPQLHNDLISLPGIGSYTAGAIMAFAFNAAVPIIETNIRTVYLHHFFSQSEKVHDRDLVLYVQKTLDRRNPRAWYAALMDYGAYLKKVKKIRSTQSVHHVKQKPFRGSDREIRGAIIRLVATTPSTKHRIVKMLPHSTKRINLQLSALEKEGLIARSGTSYVLPK